MKKYLGWLTCLSLASLVVTSAGCAGEVDDDDDDLEITDLETTSASLTSPDPGETDDADSLPAEPKDACNDHERDGHKRHRRHKFKILDRLDGDKDKVITIASLPAETPERLIKKLNKIDTDDDGLVTKREVKVFLKMKHRKHKQQ